MKTAFSCQNNNNNNNGYFQTPILKAPSALQDHEGGGGTG